MISFSPQTRLYISLGIIVSIAFVSFSIIFYGVYQVYYDPASLFRGDFHRPGDIEDHFKDRVVNVVVLGLHNRLDDNTFGDVFFVDTILVASVNFDRDSVKLLAVPRDTYVQIAHTGQKDRIRQSYSYGYETGGTKGGAHAEGMRYSLDTIGNFLDGIDIHYYIAMDIEGLEQLIDSMGGIRYTVAEDMIGYTPRESLQAGNQMLDGRGYVTYLTYREEDARDDLNRINRQKDLLLATFDYFQQQGLFNYVVPAYAAYREHVRTNLSFNQVAGLALFAGERLELDEIENFSLKGEYFSSDDGKSYYLRIDETEKKVLLKKITGN